MRGDDVVEVIAVDSEVVQVAEQLKIVDPGLLGDPLDDGDRVLRGQQRVAGGRLTGSTSTTPSPSSAARQAMARLLTARSS